jgi:hypothetical protein
MLRLARIHAVLPVLAILMLGVIHFLVNTFSITPSSDKDQHQDLRNETHKADWCSSSSNNLPPSFPFSPETQPSAL